ncbi:LacI family DNA-binding transcriptional regulator [Kineococcus rhizosphaerae]|uniref:LacI family transcriptional regulator n=1 Tax=Kineococcus rhizosphaerae TaxID=559628 RepID=A0A2T0R8U3_9ACTN|nr:LacI family DNA-binding transcriptional regulator [Kineococcus rhizosphaerae]PRY17568.1 LacI family transcriptional regulator [Kineococcus rhizosphaerae]
MPGSVTLHDVAARAGVHYSTASRVLAGAGRVSADTRARILAAAQELDFVPNAQGRFLKQGVSRTVGILTQLAAGTLSLPVLAAATATLGAADIAVLHYDAEGHPEALPEITRRLRSRRIEGLLIVGDGPEQPLQPLTAGLQVPAVHAYAVSADPTDTWFSTDGAGAGRLVADHLVDLGRTRPAHVSASGSVAAADRARGFADRLAERGTALARPPLLGDWSRAWGAAAARELLDHDGALVDAVFCGNDEIAAGVEQTLTAAGLRVPQDVALVGYDNFELRFGGREGTDLPHLTTVDPHLDLIGARAAAALLDAVSGERPLTPGAHLVPGTLVVGRTTVLG